MTRPVRRSAPQEEKIMTAPLATIAPTEVRHELDGSKVELTDIPLAPAQLGVAHNRILRKEQLADLPAERRGTLLSLCYELFVENWPNIVFGTCIQGAVYELSLGAEPSQFSYLDGYLTVFLEPSPAHMHLCIGAHQGLKHETPAELSRVRECRRAAFSRTSGEDGHPHSWSVQLWNGAGEQMITFFLPSPFLDRSREKRLREPDWSHLSLWNQLRARYLGETAPQPLPEARSSGSCGG
jgi:hypothetical protein